MESRAPSGADSVTIDDGGSAGMTSTTRDVLVRRSRRRRMLALALVLGLAAAAIVTMTARHRRNVESARLKGAGGHGEEVRSAPGGAPEVNGPGRDLDEEDRSAIKDILTGHNRPDLEALLYGSGFEVTLKDVVTGRFHPRNFYKVRGGEREIDDLLNK